MPRHVKPKKLLASSDRGPSNPSSIGDGLTALLSSVGVPSKATYDSLESAVVHELARRGHTATVISLRYGVLTLQAANPVVARQLFYDVDTLRDALNEALPELNVQRVTVRSAPA